MKIGRPTETDDLQIAPMTLYTPVASFEAAKFIELSIGKSCLFYKEQFIHPLKLLNCVNGRGGNVCILGPRIGFHMNDILEEMFGKNFFN